MLRVRICTNHGSFDGLYRSWSVRPVREAESHALASSSALRSANVTEADFRKHYASDIKQRLQEILEVKRTRALHHDSQHCLSLDRLADILTQPSHATARSLIRFMDVDGSHVLNDRSSPPSLSALLKLFDQDLCITDTVVEYALVSMADRYPDVYIMRGTAWTTGNLLHGRFVGSRYKSSLPGSTFRADGTVEPSVIVVPLHLRRHYVLAILVRGTADENMT